MKTVVHIPDELFFAVETAARQLVISRSELYTRALQNFVAQQDENVTAHLNEVYAEEPAELDAVLARMQFASLKDVSW